MLRSAHTMSCHRLATDTNPKRIVTIRQSVVYQILIRIPAFHPFFMIFALVVEYQSILFVVLILLYLTV